MHRKRDARGDCGWRHTPQGAVEGQPLLALLARLRAAVYGGYDSTLQTALPAKVLVLMHHKEYLNAGDDASSPCSLQANANPTPTPTPLPLSLTLSLSLSFALT